MSDTPKKECESMRELMGLTPDETERLDNIARGIFVEGATVCDCCQKTYEAAKAEPDRKIALALMYALAMFKAEQKPNNILSILLERIR